jgi:hypothetical protein
MRCRIRPSRSSGASRTGRLRLDRRAGLVYAFKGADVAELVDAPDLKSWRSVKKMYCFQ